MTMIGNKLMLKLGILAAAIVAVAGVAYLTVNAPYARGQDGGGQSGGATPVDLGENTMYVGPRLLGLLQRYADGAQTPTSVEIRIAHRPDLNVQPALSDYIKSVGGQNVGERRWRIPTAKALSVIQRSDVGGAVFPPGVTGQATTTYERMDSTMNTMLTAYANGATEAAAAQYAFYAGGGKVPVKINAMDASTISRIRTWLTSQSLYMPPESEFEAFGVYTRYAMVPVSKMAALTEAFPTTYLSVETFHLDQGLSMNRRGWPADPMELEAVVVEAYSPDEEDDSDSGGASGGGEDVGSSGQVPATATPGPTWVFVSPWPVGSGGGGASGAGGIDPTPVPPGYGGAGSQHIDKTPSLPPQ